MLWPRDKLPQKFHERNIAVRVLSYSYDTRAPSAEYLMQRTFYHHSSHFLRKLAQKREGLRARPVIFIGHCVGGLVIQSSLLTAAEEPTYGNFGESNTAERKAIRDSTVGVIFVDVPFCPIIDAKLSAKEFSKRIMNVITSNHRNGNKRLLDTLHDLENQATRLLTNLRPFITIFKDPSKNVKVLYGEVGALAKVGLVFAKMDLKFMIRFISLRKMRSDRSTVYKTRIKVAC